MSTDMEGGISGEDDIDIIQVDNPSDDDYNERKRLDEIWSSRERLRERRSELSLRRGVDISETQACKAYHDALGQYLIVISSLFTEVYRDQGGGTLWNETEIDTQVVNPPTELVVGDERIRVVESAEPKEIPYKGLRCIVETPSARTKTFKATIDHGFNQVEEVTQTVTVTTQWGVLDRALLLCDNFTSKIGFEVSQGAERDVHAEPI